MGSLMGVCPELECLVIDFDEVVVIGTEGADLRRKWKERGRGSAHGRSWTVYDHAPRVAIAELADHLARPPRI